MDTDNRQENSSDLAGMVVPPVGRLVATADEWEPYRLLDPAGAVVEGVAAFLRELQAAGRSPATLRSYGLDLLRWLRFLWAAGVAWDRATRLEARDFCRWLLVAGKPARSHWRKQGVITTTASMTSIAMPAPARSSTRFRWSARDGPGAPTPTTTRWTTGKPSAWDATGRRCRAGFPERFPTIGSTSCLPRCRLTSIHGRRVEPASCAVANH